MTYRGVLIGCGFFAQNHMHAWQSTPGAEIVAVCDRDPARAEQFRRDFGVAESFSDAAVMMATLRPDFADIVTTVETHPELVKLCLSHGALTICQKPFAESYAAGLEMVKAAEAAGRQLLVHENFRWQKPFRHIRAAVETGEIGRPHFLRLSFRHGHDIYANQPYLARVEELALMDVGLHLFDVARFLMGDVDSISCTTQRLNQRVRGEDAFVALLRHKDGAVTSVECSFDSRFGEERFPQTLAQVEGDGGSLELLAGYRLRRHGPDVIAEEDVEPPVPLWGTRPWHLIQESVAAFEAHVVEVLDGRAVPQPSGAHNLETLALTRAAYRSARQGETIHMAPFIAAGAER
ncbi:Gfo/Idh/MocA family protein [Plastorhodobacter daqingensis]|uniref:Gfo/Idh/MocA family protein n=1 Tax=Plastorhodobacter daqingensis TaxID=1387281 RepID=A0ABW2UGZ6_9RHOB